MSLIIFLDITATDLYFKCCLKVVQNLIRFLNDACCKSSSSRIIVVHRLCLANTSLFSKIAKKIIRSETIYKVKTMENSRIKECPRRNAKNNGKGLIKIRLLKI